MAAASPLSANLPAVPRRWRAWAQSLTGLVLVLAGLGLAWEGYKWLGLSWPVRSDDKSMPHLWVILGAVFQPARREGEILGLLLLRAALFTWREAAVGFVLGSGLGFALGALVARFRWLERGLMPYIVASQTVPLLAIAPMVVIWGGRLNWEAWLSVSLIAAYLTFFPVTINTLRGLHSPAPLAVDLLRSYAASEWQILWQLRLPAALPYIFTALKISATLSVIGAIVGELPTGIAGGLGRLILTFSYYYISGPEKLFAAVLFAAALGLVFTALVNLVEYWVLPPRRAAGQ